MALLPWDQLKQAFADLSGVITVAEGDGVPYIPGPLCRISQANSVQLGTDETRRTYDPNTSQNDILQCGLRKIRFNIQIDSDGGSLTPAIDLIEILRMRLWREESRARFRGMGMSLAEVTNAINVGNVSEDNQVIYRAVLAVDFLLAISDDYNPLPSNTNTRTAPAIPATLPDGNTNWVQTVDSATDGYIPGTLNT